VVAHSGVGCTAGSVAFAAGGKEEKQERYGNLLEGAHSAQEAELWAPIIGEFEQKTGIKLHT